jgi:hypothetical protein
MTARDGGLRSSSQQALMQHAEATNSDEEAGAASPPDAYNVRRKLWSWSGNGGARCPQCFVCLHCGLHEDRYSGFCKVLTAPPFEVADREVPRRTVWADE